MKRGTYLGSDAFVDDALGRIGQGDDLSEIPARERRTEPRPVAWFDETHADRNEAMALAYLTGGHSQSAVARHFGVHYSTVSRAARRHETGD